MTEQVVRRLAWSDVPLDRLVLPGGDMVLHRSLTSGLCRRAGDPPGVFWGVGDRGPNIKPKDAVRRYGLDHLAALIEIDGAKVMPLPTIGPALARFRLDADRLLLEAVFPLKAADGTPLDGLPPPMGAVGETEPVFTLDGAPLPESPNGADTEGIAARRDGRFWIAEEYGPSLLLADEHGVVHLRLVPAGCEDRFAGSAVPIAGRLPALAAARKLNRGFEGLAISPDGGVLYAAFQSPLAHPDRTAHEAANLVRIWALDAETGLLQGEYAYPLDPPGSFVRDLAEGPVAASDVKLSELACLGDGSLMVLERVTQSTHFYAVTPVTALPAIWRDSAHRPSLEQLDRASARALPLLVKRRLFSSDDHPAISADLEGVLLLDDGAILLSNDSDYGTEGAETTFWLIQPNR